MLPASSLSLTHDNCLHTLVCSVLYYYTNLIYCYSYLHITRIYDSYTNIILSTTVMQHANIGGWGQLHLFVDIINLSQSPTLISQSGVRRAPPGPPTPKKPCIQTSWKDAISCWKYYLLSIIVLCGTLHIISSNTVFVHFIYPIGILKYTWILYAVCKYVFYDKYTGCDTIIWHSFT